MRTFCPRCGGREFYPNRACKTCHATGRRRRYRRDPRHQLFNNARYRARVKGVPFALRLEDIVVPRRCPVLGIPIIPGSGPGGRDNSPNLDRLIPERGYVPGNVVVISGLANRIKNTASARQIRRVAEWMEGKGLL